MGRDRNDAELWHDLNGILKSHIGLMERRMAQQSMQVAGGDSSDDGEGRKSGRFRRKE